MAKSRCDALVDGIMDFSLLKYVISFEVFPIDYIGYNRIAGNDGVVASSEKYGVHLWNQMWVRNNRDRSSATNEALF